MNPVSQCQASATIKIGGEAKFVSAPPMEMLTNKSAKVAYFRGLDGSSTKNFSDKSIAQIVIAAGSVINEPEIADRISKLNHHD